MHAGRHVYMHIHLFMEVNVHACINACTYIGMYACRKAYVSPCMYMCLLFVQEVLGCNACSYIMLTLLYNVNITAFVYANVIMLHK